MSDERMCRCGHKEWRHATGVTSTCLACLECKNFREEKMTDWMGDGPREVVPDPNPVIEITQDQWEGLQNELSMLKSAVTDLEGLASKTLAEEESIKEEIQSTTTWVEGLGVSYTTSTSADNLGTIHVPPGVVVTSTAKPEKTNPEKWESNWGQDDPWEERVAIKVNIDGSPFGLLLGPFVLITEEERETIARNWDLAAALAEGYLDQIEEMQNRLDLQSKDLAAALENSEITSRNWKQARDSFRERTDMLEAALVARNEEIERLQERIRAIESDEGFTATSQNPLYKSRWQQLVEEGPEEES